ncbi:hypothetical protein GCM10007938_23590 [Vibrio zhanjiangensis]|uniref:DUF1552 domain-containing protein n=1 Tax=Vibrio zhanjiangensis TaxID=1046128 RepID=A0ABQ6EZD5_9VIBR|nr:DUF1552 domain-containing protein [Vibrio zhanjiangensis]GLT18580.1 hypothetical protein GCM10007938_23590 [Vibrio zhanjiangensis]
MSTSSKFTRRAFLKSAAYTGATVGLSSLPIPSLASGASNQTKFIFINFSDGYPRGTWHPEGNSGALKMNLCTADLEPYKDDIIFFSGCRSEGGSGHGGYNGVWQEKNGQGSIDVHFENAYSTGMPKRAVRIGVDTNYWGHGSLVTSRSVVGSAQKHNDNPDSIFQELFGSSGGESPTEQRKLDLLGSYLDDVALLSSNLNGLEQGKLDSYAQATTATKTELENALSNSGVCNTSLYSSSSFGRDKTADLQVANAALALSCQKTRIVSLQFGTSNDSAVVKTVSSIAPHDASHYGSAILKSTYIAHRQWYVSKIIKLIEYLKTLNLYDDCILYVTSEMDDGQAHSSNDLPCMLIGGKNTKLSTQSGGRIVNNVGPIGRVLVSLANAYGVSVPYTSSAIPEIFNR